jgi:hypothetical protein
LEVTKMKRTAVLLVLVLVLVVCNKPVNVVASPLGTAFTYQGRLIDANKAAGGPYDFQFKLFDANIAGNQLGTDINKPEVNAVDGYFTVELDFGSVFDGNERWLEIGVRPGDQNDSNTYTTLSPRQKVTPTPYAMYALGFNASQMPAGSVVQVVNYETGAPAFGTNPIPRDDTIPQNTEGTEFMTCSITPTNANNKLKIDVVFIGSAAVTNGFGFTVALFEDSNPDAIAVTEAFGGASGSMTGPVCFTHYMTAGTTSLTTFKVRAGGLGFVYPVCFNTSAEDYGQRYGGKFASSITITEIKQ